MMNSTSPQLPSTDAQNSPHITFHLADKDLNTDRDQDSVQVLFPPGHPPTHQDWEAYRAVFTQLYRTENMPLKEVTSAMADQYGFKATPIMSKKRIIEWKLNKNYKSSERKVVARVVEQYKNRDDPIPPIILHGQPVKMHRIQRHCKVGQSTSRPREPAGSFHSSTLEIHAGETQPSGLTMEYNKDMYLQDGMGVTAENLSKIISLITIPLRQISPPHELKHAEFVLFQTNTLYECYAQSLVMYMKDNAALRSRAENHALRAANPNEFKSKSSYAICMLVSKQPRAGWRLLHEAMDMVKPMLATKHPGILKMLLHSAWEWEKFLLPDLYRMIWRQISEMAAIILGENDPLSKVCMAINNIKLKSQVYEVAIRLIRSIFERTLGPYDVITLDTKFNHVASMLETGDLAGAERLQRTIISDSKKLKDRSMREREVMRRTCDLGYILMYKRDFVEAKKVIREALRLGRISSREKFPTQNDIYCIEMLVSVLAENEYAEGEILLHEALEKCLTYEHWGRCDWRTITVLRSLKNLLQKQKKFQDAEMLMSQYPEAF